MNPGNRLFAVPDEVSLSFLKSMFLDPFCIFGIFYNFFFYMI